MKISTKGRYALRVMIDLAINNTGEYIPLKDISDRQGITVKYMEQIIPLLKRAGFLKSTRGNNGGYMLSRAPKDYTAGDILRAAEGSLAPVSCLEEEDYMCERLSICPTRTFWEGLADAIDSYVDSVTLQDMLDEYESHILSNYSI